MFSYDKNLLQVGFYISCYGFVTSLPNPNPFSGFHIITGMSGMVWVVPLPVDAVARLSSSVLQDVAVPNQLRPGRYQAKQWSIRSKGDVWSAGLYTDSEIMGCCYNWYWPRTYHWWGGILTEDKWLFFFSSNVFYTLNNIQLSPEGEVNSGGCIPRREASRYISTALHRPWGG